MKFAAPLLVFLATAVSTTLATECTMAQIQPLANKPEVTAVNSACAGVVGGGGSSIENVKKICDNTKCVQAFKTAAKLFPDCEIQGMNLNALSGQIDTTCKAAGSTESPPSSSTTSTSAAVSVAAASTTVAVVAAAFMIAV